MVWRVNAAAFAFVKSVHNIKSRKERLVKLIPKATHITWTTMECSGSCKRWRRSSKTNKRRVMKPQMTQLRRRRANIVPLSLTCWPGLSLAPAGPYTVSAMFWIHSRPTQRVRLREGSILARDRGWKWLFIQHLKRQPSPFGKWKTIPSENREFEILFRFERGL